MVMWCAVVRAVYLEFLGVWVGGGADLEFSDHGVLGVDFESLLGVHPGVLLGVSESLGLHDALHVGSPAKE